MGYYNRKKQLITTLETIKKSKHKDFSVIIVDDASNEEHKLNDIIDNYDFPIKLIRIEPKNKTWKNSCIPYNIGFKHADGDIIIIQNPEVCHIGDVMSYVNDNLEKDQYITFSCYASPHYMYNDKLNDLINNVGDNDMTNYITNNFINKINYDNFKFSWKFYKSKYKDVAHLNLKRDLLKHWLTIGMKEDRICNGTSVYASNNLLKNKGWLNHPIYRNSSLHFLSASYQQNIKKIKGFDESYKDGSCYEDNNFLLRMKQITKVSIIPPDKLFGIHQYHGYNSSFIFGSDKKMIKINADLFKKLHEKIKNGDVYLTNYDNGIFSSNVPVQIYTNKFTSNYL